jgi:hypothetical protein
MTGQSRMPSRRRPPRPPSRPCGGACVLCFLVHGRHVRGVLLVQELVHAAQQPPISPNYAPRCPARGEGQHCGELPPRPRAATSPDAIRGADSAATNPALAPRSRVGVHWPRLLGRLARRPNCANTPRGFRAALRRGLQPMYSKAVHPWHVGRHPWGCRHGRGEGDEEKVRKSGPKIRAVYVCAGRGRGGQRPARATACRRDVRAAV